VPALCTSTVSGLRVSSSHRLASPHAADAASAEWSQRRQPPRWRVHRPLCPQLSLPRAVGVRAAINRYHVSRAARQLEREQRDRDHNLLARCSNMSRQPPARLPPAGAVTRDVAAAWGDGAAEGSGEAVLGSRGRRTNCDRAHRRRAAFPRDRDCSSQLIAATRETTQEGD
jgi:hypothetical protein